MERARRIDRIESPTIDVTLRGAVNVSNVELWREDRLVYDGATYLVLDFGLEQEQRLRPLEEGDEDTVWMATGALSVAIQRIDATTGEGLAQPTMKEISDAGGQVTWTNWQVVPCSPRRPAADADSAPINVDEPVTADAPPCVMCGAESVQVDADGFGHCPNHIGESPELVIEAEGQ